MESAIQEDYPLAEPLVLYLHPKAPASAKAFCDFAVGPEGSAVLEKLGFVTPCVMARAEAEKRLADWKSGKGTPVKGVGCRGGRLWMNELAVEYVKSKTVVQMAYGAITEPEAVARFLAGRAELLLIEGSLHERTRSKYGERLKAMKATRHRLAKRAVAVVTHKSNPLNRLPLDKLRDIFGSKVRTWSDFGGKEDEIHLYGLDGRSPTGRVFFDKVLEARRCRQVKVKADSKAVLSAVAVDSLGIGFVDFAAIPEDARSIKSIKILDISADNADAAGDTGSQELSPLLRMLDGGTKVDLKTMLSDDYPLGEWLHLYVSPTAGATTRDFVKFILSAHCRNAFRKHGLLAPPVQKAEPTATAKDGAASP